MFTYPDSDSIIQVQGYYIEWSVILSVFIACAAAYTAISLNQRMQQSSFFHKSFWLVLSSFTMGLGIWSMHFIGMSAFVMPLEMEYNVILTIISIFPAILASYFAFYIVNQSHRSYYPIVFASITLGTGIAAMHYLGMIAMEMNADYYYRPWIFAGSIGIAYIVSFAALFTFSNLQNYMSNKLTKLFTSLLLGLAVSSMHYSGMTAVVFYTEEAEALHAHAQHSDMLVLIGFISTGIILLLLISSLTSIFDRYIDHRINYIDSLTLFFNQRQFEKDIEQTVNDGSIAIIQIQNLEKYHLAFGYEFGEEIIKYISRIIQRDKLVSTKIYRIDENHFSIINAGDRKESFSKKALEKLLATLQKPLKIGDHQVVIEVQAAISYAEDNNSLRRLYLNASAALQYPAKNSYTLIEYNAEVHSYSLEKQLIFDIDSALKNGELFLVYQPKVCSETGQVTGAEALLRWNHSKLGMISPAVFVPILERGEKIYDVTNWVIEETCKQISVWSISGTEVGPVSINIPGAYVTSLRLLHVLRENLSKYQLKSNRLEIEITETSVIHDIENAIIAVKEFRKIGIAVALDDFGTGLSSLSYLKRLPVSTIKIDKSFVDGITESDRDASLLRAIVSLCNSLKLTVVIEGVETKEQFNFIQTLSETPYIQGYFFSKPLTADEFLSWTKIPW